MLRSTNRCQEVPRSAKRYGEVPKGTERCQDVLRGAKRYREVQRGTERCQEVLRGAKRYQQSFKKPGSRLALLQGNFEKIMNLRKSLRKRKGAFVAT